MDYPSNGRQMSPSDRLDWLLERFDGRCAWCGFELSRPGARPTRDHVVPKIKGGPARLENEVPACASCNGLRGHEPPSRFIERSRDERGLEPDAAGIASQLEALERAIGREGGMRKIRDYVTRELRRVQALAQEEPRQGR